MPGHQQQGRRWGGTAALCAVALALAWTPTVHAAGPPVLGPVWASEVDASSARLHGEVTPNGLSTAYHFDYLPAASYEANIGAGKDPFAGAAKAPAGNDAAAGTGATPVPVSQLLSALASDTAYRYRLVAKNSAGTTAGTAASITTQPLAGASVLLDGRAWEMVSPLEKDGGAVAAPETLAGGGVQQAAAAGGAVTYGSSSSFGGSAQGAPPASQYIARRGAGGWSSENITTPILSGSYGSGQLGVPYQLFSNDLARGLLLNGRHCRGGGENCPVANPPLPGSGAPAGYQNYYLRDSASGGFRALLDAGDIATTPLSSSRFDLAFAGANPDLRRVVLSTCAALTADAVEVPDGERCDADSPNLYEWTEAGLGLINLLPGQGQGTPGAALAAPTGAVATGADRVYFTLAGNLYLRQGGATEQVDEAAGGGGKFETAAADGSVAFFTKGEELWRYDAAAMEASELSDGVLGVLGASADASHLYYLTSSGLLLHVGAETRTVAGAADPGSYPPATGMARVSADGRSLAFVSSVSLTGFDNVDQGTGELDALVYLYDASTDSLTCVSCNPTGSRPIGSSSLPGAYANGAGASAPRPYRPRALSADGRRLFFDSADALVLFDTNRRPDVYEWEAQGKGTCNRAGGCLALISSGKGEGASFLDASADGSDAFFLTERSLVAADPGSLDLYDARVGGGFPDQPTPIPCEGDACQILPSEPENPPVTTLIAGPGNPPLRYTSRHRPKRHKKGKRKSSRQHKQAKGQRGGKHAGGRR